MTLFDPYHVKGNGIEAELPSNKFQGVGKTWACRTWSPVWPQLSISTDRAGASIKAKSVGMIPSPRTVPSRRPRRGKYDVAATNSSMLVVKNVPFNDALPTHVTEIPRLANACDEHASSSSTSLSNPRVWSTSASSGDVCGEPIVIKDVHRSCANRATGEDDLLNPPRKARDTQPPMEWPMMQIFASGPSSSKISVRAVSIASKYQYNVLWFFRAPSR